MNVISITEDCKTTLCLDGELDHHAAKSATTRIRQILEAEPSVNVVLDLGAMSFMDSSGIAVVVSTHRFVTGYGGNLSVVNIPSHAFRIFRAAGLTRMIPMHERTSRTERRFVR